MFCNGNSRILFCYSETLKGKLLCSLQISLEWLTITLSISFYLRFLKYLSITYVKGTPSRLIHFEHVINHDRYMQRRHFIFIHSQLRICFISIVAHKTHNSLHTFFYLHIHSAQSGYMGPSNCLKIWNHDKLSFIYSHHRSFILITDQLRRKMVWIIQKNYGRALSDQIPFIRHLLNLTFQIS